MGKMGAYQPTDKYKNYSLPTSKPFRSETFYYKEKVWTLQELIYNKLKKVAEFLEILYPKLTDDVSMNVKVTIENNLETLIKDLDLMQSNLQKDPLAFNTKKLKINQKRINEMKHVCDTLQAMRSYEHEYKKLSKIKHLLAELEHLIQPTKFEMSLVKTPVISKPKAVAAKKAHSQLKTQKKIKEKLAVTPKKPKAISKKAKSAPKLTKPKKIDSKKLIKSAAPIKKVKKAPKKVTQPKAKVLVKNKKALTPKPKTKAKSAVAHKKK